MHAAPKVALSILTGILLLSTARSDEPTNGVKSAAALVREEARQRRAKLPLAKGTLETVDLLRHQLKIKTEDGPRTFTYTPRTYFFRAKDKITPDKLQIGETIAVRFVTGPDGVVSLQRVKVYGLPQPANATVPE